MDPATDQDVPDFRYLNIAYGNLKTEIIIGIISAIIIAGVAFQTVTLQHLLIWLVCTLAIYAVRFMLGANFDENKLSLLEHVNRRRNLFLIGLFLTGCCWTGLAILTSISDNYLSTSLVLFWIVCLGIMITGFYAGLIIATLVFIIPGISPAAFYVAINSEELSIILPTAGLIATVVLLFRTQLAQQVLFKELEFEQEVNVLTEHLSTRKTQVDKLTVGLKTNAEKREEAENDLRRTSADLGLVRSKAKALADALQRVTPHDSVTGIGNAHHFDETLNVEWQRAMRERKPISILFLDIDFFELYHESYGTQTTDHTLTRLAKILANTGRRGGDVAARIDDGKFKILLPGADTNNCTRMAESVRHQIELLKLPFKNSPIGETITVSVGVASMIPSPQVTMEELNNRAKDALYEAGFRGGNKTVCFKAISNVRVDRWDTNIEGPLSVDGMVRKLSILGYKSERKAIKPGDYLADESFNSDIGIAALSGQLKITVDGEAILLKHGDIMLIPAGTPRSMEVEGKKESHYLDCVKTA